MIYNVHNAGVCRYNMHPKPKYGESAMSPSRTSETWPDQPKDNDKDRD